MTTAPELALQARELALLLDAVEDYAIFLLGAEGEIRTWNSGAARVFGYPAEEIVGANASRFYLDADVERGKLQHELETAASTGRVEDEGWCLRRDGTRFWANTIITPLRNAAGSVTGFAQITRDLTRKNEAEQRLRQSEEVFRLLVASVKEYAIFLLDPGGHIVTWNAGAEGIKGYSPAEIVGRHFSVFYPEEDRRNRKPERELEVARETGSIEDEGWRLRKDGSRFWANVVITAVFDEVGKLRGFAKVTRDLTERRHAEETQRALLEQREARTRAEAAFRVAQESNRAKDEFLMTLSHELRTPLTAILGWSRLLPTIPPDDQAFSEAVAAIGRSAQVQAQLIDDVLDVSRIVSGKLRLNVEAVDLPRIANAAIDAVRPGASARRITIATEIEPDIGPIVADATRLQQILWNLLTNAVKFTPEGGRIVLTVARRDDRVEVAVADNGQGIDPAFLPHVFEPFRQAENPSTRVHGGLGLGLSIVRYLTEAHGGSVGVESAGPGLGSTFRVSFPLRPLPQGQAVTRILRAPTPAAAVDQRLLGMKILLVDDDAEGRAVLRAVLRRAGADLTDVDSAACALERLAQQVPDLVVTDIAMPHVDGYALAARIRELIPQLPVVALSAFPASSTGRAEVFDGYIMKPVDPPDLVDTLARLVSRDSSGH